MAGYQGYSLKGDKSSSKQVDKTIGKRKSNKNNSNSGRSFGSQNKSSGNKNNSNSGNSSNGARLGGGLAREAKNKVDKKNKNESSGNKNKVAEILTDFVQDPGGTVKKGGKIANEAVNNFGKGVKDFFMGKGVEEKEEKKKKEEEKIVQKEQEQLVQNNASEQQSEQNTQKEDETKAKTQDDTVYSSQNEWLLSFLNINSNNKGSIREISDEERKIIIDKMEKYWRNNLGRGLSVEYLVNGAVMRCACGKTLFNIVGKDHKVYADSTEQLAMLNDTDKKLSSGCKVCDYVGYSYAYEDLEWVEKSNIEIGDNNSKALTMNSYMLCTLKQDSNKAEVGEHFKNYFNKYKNSQSETMAKELENNLKEAANIREQAQGKPGIIKPVTSGQEFTIGSKIFIYPKFISDIHSDKDAFDTYWETHDFGKNCPIDSGVVKRLMTRNFERMSYTEKLWFYRLAKFFILNKNFEQLDTMVNMFFIHKEINTGEKCSLSENFSILLKCAEFHIKKFINFQRIYNISEDNIKVFLRNYLLLLYIKNTNFYYSSETNSILIASQLVLDDDKKNYGKNGINIKYNMLDPIISNSITVSTVDVKISETKDLLDAKESMGRIISVINKENARLKNKTMLGVNIIITIALGLGFDNVNKGAEIGTALSVGWTVLSSLENNESSRTNDSSMVITYEGKVESLFDFLEIFEVKVAFIRGGYIINDLKFIALSTLDTGVKINNFIQNIKNITIDEERLIDKLRIKENNYIDSKVHLKLGGMQFQVNDTCISKLNRLIKDMFIRKIQVDETRAISGWEILGEIKVEKIVNGEIKKFTSSKMWIDELANNTVNDFMEKK